MDLEKLRGTVRWFSAKKGYGFIAPEDGGKDIFVHWSGISMEGYKQLAVDDQVEFALKDSPKGPIAIEVQIISPANKG